MNLTQIETFLDNISLPALTEDHIAELEAPITSEEVGEVIRNLKGGTAPGPDGFSVPYYKAFSEILTPYLNRFFNSKKDGALLGNQLNSAYISVIPKPDKDAGIVGNYRPISLINNNLKILTKVLANCIATFINQIIHKDQVGFIPGQGMSLDLQKAFDSVS